MNKVIIACNDNPNVELHDFFEYSADLIVETCEKLGIPRQRIGMPNLTSMELSKHSIGAELYCIASHGNNSSIEDGYKQDLISKQTMVNYLHDKVLYAIACSCGKDLPSYLLNNGLKAFVGYNDELVVQEGYAQFAKSAVQGAVSLLEGHTLRESLNIMNAAYDNYFDELDKIDHKVAAILLDNQEHLIAAGDMDYKLIK